MSTLDSRDERLHGRAGVGGLLGIATAILVPMYIFLNAPSLDAAGVLLIPSFSYVTFDVIFILGLGLSALFQIPGARRLNRLLGSGYPNLLIILALVCIFGAGWLYATAHYMGLAGVNLERTIVGLLTFINPLVIIIWQMSCVIYIDSSKSVTGLLAGLCNGFFVPLLAVGIASPALHVLVPLAFGVLAFGQLFAVMFWWTPHSHIREFARSSAPAKTGFALAGVLTFLFGLVPLLDAIDTSPGVSLWVPWSTYEVTGETTAVFLTAPWLVTGFLASILLWVLLSPRLGAKELKASHIRTDVIKGSIKWLMAIFAMLGLIIAGAASSLSTSTLGDFWIFLTISPAAAIFVMGMVYMGDNDVITGLPLLLTSVFMIILPYSLSVFITTAWVAVIITQLFVLVETRIRGLTVFSQPVLTVVATVAASAMFVVFMLGGFGSGPAALWPANRWFNVTLFSGIAPELQAPTVFGIVILTLLVRNVALVGYAYGRGFSGAGMIGVMTLLFTLMIVMIAGNFDITHQALTAGALIFMLYTISFVLVLSLNLNLGSSVLAQGHALEGNLLRVSAAYGMVFGAIVALVAFSTFSVLNPQATAISFAITLMISLVVSLEILQLIGWMSAGVRLGLIKGGFKFSRIERQS